MFKKILMFSLLILALFAFSAAGCDAEPVDSETYSITFNVDGGIMPDSVITSYTVSETDIELPTPTRSGYDFLGWKAGDNAPVKKIAAGTKGDLSLTAAWQIKTYNISFDLKGGEMAETDLTSYTVSETDIELPTPTRSGYVFLGWKAGDNAPVTKITAGTTGDLSFIAVWQWDGASFTVTFDNASNSDLTSWTDGTTGVKTVQINLGDVLNVPTIKNDVASAAEKNNSDYVFGYWYYLDDAGNKHKVSFGKEFTADNYPTDKADITFYVQVIKQWVGPY